MLLKEAVCPEGGSTFQKTWYEPVFSSPLVRSPHPKYRSPDSRLLYSRTGLPRGSEKTSAPGVSTAPIPSSLSSTANSLPEASANPIRRGFKETWAVAAVVESVSSSSDSFMETSTAPQSPLATPSESYLGGPPAG